MGSQPSVYAVFSWPNSYCQSELTRCCILLAFNTQHTLNMSQTAAGKTNGFKASSTWSTLVSFRIQTPIYGDIVFKPIRGLKKEVSSFLVIYLDWDWSWFIFDTENFVCLNFHFFLPQFVISNQRLWHRNKPFEFLPSSPSLPPQITKIQRQIRIEKDKFIMSWMLPHEKILFPRVHPWRLITLDDAHVHGMSKYFALLRVSSDKDVMAIQINLYQGIPNLMNISDNKMVQIPEHHHTINVKN